MRKFTSCLVLFIVLLSGCGRLENGSSRQDLATMQAAITLCAAENSGFGKESKPVLNLPDHPRLLGDRTDSPWPLIQANDCRKSAGTLRDGILNISLEIQWGDFRPETNDRPGVLVTAIAETGKAPSIPAPMIRVEEGTIIRAKLHNPLMDSSARFYGIHSRTKEKQDSIFLNPGETKTVEFLAGQPGNYLYKVVVGKDIKWEFGEEEQLSGAFIIDPKGYDQEDRVIVMNIFRTRIDTALHKYGWLEPMSMNGKSWPFSELLRSDVGKKERWKIINGTGREHPMHLHGFFFDVIGEGDVYNHESFATNEREHVVTKNMEPFSTLEMEWTPTRPGRWLFHCHIPYHVTSDIRLPEADKLDHPESHFYHMAGLVMGLEIADGESDLMQKGPSRKYTLVANELDTLQGFRMRFSHENGKPVRPGPSLILKQYQPTFVTVENQMSQSTAVHWHGLELDAWADGVPEWSASDSKSSPEIVPRGNFTYQLSLMNPGTYIYHSHLNDIEQLTEGLYGVIIVIPEGKTYDPKFDHSYIVGQKMINDAESPEDIDINGVINQPTIKTQVGTMHRLRLINIGLVHLARLEMTKNGEPYTMKLIAKDGPDLPVHMHKDVLESDGYSVGETADFLFNPKEQGNYSLKISYYGQTVEQIWKVVNP